MIDGYSWEFDSLSQIDITLIQSSEVKNVKSENEDYDIGEELVIEYPSWMKNKLSGLKTNMKTNGVNCFLMAILYVISRKVYLTNNDIEEYSKMFNWKGIDIEKPVRREEIKLCMKNNPKYYLVIYLYSNLTEETKKP